jgi:hypothetical protein
LGSGNAIAEAVAQATGSGQAQAVAQAIAQAAVGGEYSIDSMQPVAAVEM